MLPGSCSQPALTQACPHSGTPSTPQPRLLRAAAAPPNGCEVQAAAGTTGGEYSATKRATGESALPCP